MIQIELHRSFVKSFDKRIRSNTKLVRQFNERVSLFEVNPDNPVLKDHGLIGKKSGLRSFSINGDLRIIYYLVSENCAEFIDIGSHNQVY